MTTIEFTAQPVPSEALFIHNYLIIQILVNFRLQKSSEVLQNLEREIKHYEDVRKKYNRARGIFTKISVCSGMLSVILSASGLRNFSYWFWSYYWCSIGCCWRNLWRSICWILVLQHQKDFQIKLANMNRPFL